MCTKIFQSLFHNGNGKLNQNLETNMLLMIKRNLKVSVEKISSFHSDTTIMYVLPKSLKTYLKGNTEVVLFQCNNGESQPLNLLFLSTYENAVSLSNNLNSIHPVRIEGVFYNCNYFIEGQDTSVVTTCDLAFDE